MLKYLKSASVLSILSLVFSLITPAGVALAAGSNISGAVSQTYNTNSTVLTGMIVELKPKSQTIVMPLTAKDIGNALGVVVPTSDANIVLTPASTSTQQVLVAPSGTYNVLVSNQNGPIKSGDYLTVSALSGISMKADTTQTYVIGRATSSFNGASNVVLTVPLKSDLGHTTNVSIGSIPVNFRLGANPLYQSSDFLPSSLSKLANSVASKTVTPIRVYLSAIILLGVILIISSMFYSGVRTGLGAIGRNPLAKKAVVRGLVKVMVAGLIVFVAGILAAYLILV